MIKGVKTEIRHKVLPQVSVRGLHIDMLKQYDAGFSMAYDDEVIVRINYSSVQFILPPLS